MSTHKYDFNLVVTLEDFQKSNYKKVLRKASKEGFTYYGRVLSSEAKSQIEQGNVEIGKVLWLLADLSSFMMHPENTQEVFSPLTIMQGTMSAIPEDFNDNDILFFKQIVEMCDDFRLKARIADILWYLKKDFQYIKIAIENYIQFPLDTDNLHIDSKNSFERAIRLAISTKQINLLEEIQNLLFKVFYASKPEDNNYCNHVNNLLLIANIDINSNLGLIQKLEEFAQEFETKKEWRTARKYYQAAKKWFKKLSDTNNMNQLTVKVAETFVSEAESRKDSQMVAATLYNNAMQEFRSIPKVHRAALNIDNRIQEVSQLMGISNKLAHGELQHIETEGIDISKLINNSRSQIKNKDFEKALIIFANISIIPQYNSLSKSSKERLESPNISGLFNCTHFSQDGRVISITKGGLDTEAHNQQLTVQMRRQYSIELGLIIQGLVLPAFGQLITEHSIRKDYLVSLCLNASLVPRDRALLWAEGLYFGFENNFLVSTHLLIPQIEHLIRVLLKQEGIQTTVLEPTGIEKEKGLSTLLNEKKISELIGRDLLFNLKSLLTENIGYNLRNNIAHGLSEYDNFRSIEHIYLWWLCFKLVIDPSHLVKDE